MAEVFVLKREQSSREVRKGPMAYTETTETVTLDVVHLRVEKEFPPYSFENPEDAVIAYANEVRELEKKAADGKKNLEAMRAALWGDAPKSLRKQVEELEELIVDMRENAPPVDREAALCTRVNVVVERVRARKGRRG